MTTTVTQTQSLAQFAPGLAATGKTPAQIMSAARDFESVFATQMLTPMYEGMDVDPMFGGGHGEEMFRTMMLDEYGKQIGRERFVRSRPLYLRCHAESTGRKTLMETIERVVEIMVTIEEFSELLDHENSGHSRRRFNADREDVRA